MPLVGRMFLPRRKRVRDKTQNYAGPGVWFLTIDTLLAECLFGEIIDKQMFVNDLGLIAQRHWEAIPQHFPHARLDRFVVMPNHLHGILWLASCDPRLQSPEDLEQRFGHPVRGSVGTIVGSFKAIVTRDVRRMFGGRVDIWEGGFHDTRVRNQDSLDKLRKYIANNPARWAERHGSRKSALLSPSPT